MNKDKVKDIIIIILSVIAIILFFICIGLIIKKEFLDNDDTSKYNNSDSSVNSSNIENNNNSNNYISRDEAIDIALKDIKLSKSDVYDLDVELENKFNTVVYEVVFDYNRLEYEYYINATDGSIIKSFSERD